MNTLYRKKLRRVLFIFKTLLYLFILILSLLLKVFKKYRDIWIISERGDDARDNGYYFFEYLMSQRNRPDVYYIIDKKSSDYTKIKEYTNVIHRGSLKHWLYFCLARIKISTHIMGYSPDRYLFTWLDKYLGIVFGKKVFLQHGITKDNIKALHYPNVKLDLFICGTAPEFNYVLKNFGHPKGVVKYTGLARFDNLHDFDVNRQILLMPTWRQYLKGCSESEFKLSEYFKRYTSLICSDSLHWLLEHYDYKLIFYPHYEMQKYIHLFSSNHPRIAIAGFADYDVQKLLMESALLITDYSSVFFDFAYMKKPVIYYQFDYDTFRKKHYNEGYYDYCTMGFGNAVATEDDLINSVKAIVNADCAMSEEYKRIADSFFKLNDKTNCERIYNCILNLT